MNYEIENFARKQNVKKNNHPSFSDTNFNFLVNGYKVSIVMNMIEYVISLCYNYTAYRLSLKGKIKIFIISCIRLRGSLTYYYTYHKNVLTISF